MTPTTPEQLAGGILLSHWRKQVGLSTTTCWRLRKAGKLKTITRYGHIYVTAAGNAEFFQDDGSKPCRPGPQALAAALRNPHPVPKSDRTT